MSAFLWGLGCGIAVGASVMFTVMAIVALPDPENDPRANDMIKKGGRGKMPRYIVSEPVPTGYNKVDIYDTIKNHTEDSFEPRDLQKARDLADALNSGLIDIKEPARPS